MKFSLKFGFPWKYVVIFGLILLPFSGLFVNNKQKTVNLLSNPADSSLFFDEGVDFPRKNSVNKSQILSFGQKVMLQPYYWIPPDDGKLWQYLTNSVLEFSSDGFDSLWLPPASKTENTYIARYGYEPYDYYDLGEFNQKGSIRTRYGTRSQLEQLIQQANSNNIGVIADIVINHCSGGDLEYNPFTGTQTVTNFMNVASGKFLRNYTDFHPCAYEEQDDLKFGGLPDLCHKNPYVHDECIKYGTWLKNVIGYDGWRFDVAMGVNRDMLRDWMMTVAGWGVAEYWNGQPIEVAVIDEFLTDMGGIMKAFDYPLMYELRKMIIKNGSYDMRLLESAGLIGIEKDLAITFVANHDTDKVDATNIPFHRELAYAYILTHEGYPLVFWKDYVNFELQHHIRTLMTIHNEYARGATEILYTDADLYIMQRNGDPGLILILNDNLNEGKTQSIHTKWTNCVLHDLTGQSSDIVIDSNGNTTIQIPPLSYAIYSLDPPIMKVPPIPSFSTHQIPTVLRNASINIDGKFDYSWHYPIYMDRAGDAGFKQDDLTRLYITYDDSNLYVGFAYEKAEGVGDTIHYGIALDCKPGGSQTDPGWHNKIRFTGSSRPDFIFYLQMHPLNFSLGEIEAVKRFKYLGDHWDEGITVDPICYSSDAMYGFAEIQIPFSDLDLSTTTSISMKVFSTTEGFPKGIDSVPHDTYINDKNEEYSYIVLPSSFELPIMSTTSSLSDTSSSIQGYQGIVLTLFIGLGWSVILALRLQKGKK